MRKLMMLLAMSMMFTACGPDSEPPQCCKDSEQKQDLCRVGMDCEPEDCELEVDCPTPPSPSLVVDLAVKNVSETTTNTCRISYTLPNQAEVLVWEGVLAPNAVKTVPAILTRDAAFNVTLAGGCYGPNVWFSFSSTNYWISSSKICTFNYYERQQATILNCKET